MALDFFAQCEMMQLHKQCDQSSHHSPRPTAHGYNKGHSMTTTTDKIDKLKTMINKLEQQTDKDYELSVARKAMGILLIRLKLEDTDKLINSL